MSEDSYFDSDKASAAIGKMWRELGEKLAAAALKVTDDGAEPVEAVQWATCAEACFWKATGESDTHDVKDVLGVLGVDSRAPGQESPEKSNA